MERGARAEWRDGAWSEARAKSGAMASASAWRSVHPPPGRTPSPPPLGWHYSSKATCLVRPHSFSAAFLV